MILIYIIEEKMVKYLWNRITLLLLLLTFIGISIFFYTKWMDTENLLDGSNIFYQNQIKEYNQRELILQHKIDSISKIPPVTNETKILTKYKNKYNIIVLNDDSIKEFFRTELSPKDSIK